MSVTLSQLLTAVSADQEKAKLIAGLQGVGFPVTDWQVGGVERTLIESESAALSDLAALIPQIAAGGFLSTSTGDWLTLLAHELYEIDRNPALSTIGNESFYCIPGAGPYTITPSQLSILGISGNRYSNLVGGVLSAPGFTPVTHVGAGAGTLVPSATSLPSSSPTLLVPARIASSNGKSYTVLITTSGAAGGAARYTLSYDGKQTFAIPLNVPNGSTTADPATGLVLTFAGNFVLNDTYTFSSGGQLDLSIQSEHPNDSPNGFNYVDSNNTLTTLSTPLPGVTVNNPPVLISATSHTGSGLGQMTGNIRLWAGVSTCSITAQITKSGNSADSSGSFSYSINGNAPLGPFPLVTTYTDASLIALNLNLTFTDAAITTSFLQGDIYNFSVPGSWITQQGTDQESDAALAQRCADRWPSLGFVPTYSPYDLWARTASPQVTRTSISVSQQILNVINVYIAGQGGGLPPNVVNAVQSYINPRAGITDRPFVQTVTTQPITLTGTVSYHSTASLPQIKAAAQTAVQNYITGLPIGGSNPPVLVRLLDILSAVATGAYSGQVKTNPILINGVVDFIGLTINGFATNYQVGSSLPVVATFGDITTMLTFTQVL